MASSSRTAHVFDDFSPESLLTRGSAKWSHHEPGIINAWVAEMDFAAAPPVLEAIQDAVRRQEFGYPVREEATGLQEAVADWEATRYGWTVDPSRIHIVPDVLKGVELAIEQFSPTDSAVILPTPAYMPFFEVPKVVRRPTILVPTLLVDGVRRLDYAAIDDAFAQGGGTIILCHPYNPLGRSFTTEEMEQLSEIVDRHRGRVVSDEIHAPLTYPGARHVPYASVSEVTAGHTLTMVSASKAWNLPGLKCAQVITANEIDEQRWRTISVMKTHGASTFGIRSNLAAFRDGADWLADALGYLDGNRRFLAELIDAHLPGVRYTVPEATYLAWLDCTALELGAEPSEFFLQNAKVAVNPGVAFGPDGAGCVRFNFATSRAILEQAITAMGAAAAAR